MQRKEKKMQRKNKNKNNPDLKSFGKPLSKDEVMTEKEGRQERKKFNSLFRKMSISEVPVKRRERRKRKASEEPQQKRKSKKNNCIQRDTKVRSEMLKVIKLEWSCPIST